MESKPTPERTEAAPAPHRLRARWGLLLCLALGVAIPAALAEPSDPESRFARPPASARILKIIHGWPDNPAQQDALIRALSTQGFGGVVCNVSHDGYLESEPRWQDFVRAVEAARQAGLALWLYDERGYPSGTAGGQVLRGHPEWEAEGLLIADTECGPGLATVMPPPGSLLHAAAFPVEHGRLRLSGRLDLAGHVRDGALNWTAPEGRWRILLVTRDRLYDGTHADLNLAEKMPYPNLLRPEPTARFLELTHERYVRHLGPDLGRYFIATFTDEPSLMSLFLKRMPYRTLPWAPALSDEFRKRNGYALDPWLPALVADAGPDGARARHDFWQTVAGLVEEHFFGQIQTWCRRHNVRSGGHLLAEEGLTAHVPLYGDFLACLRRLDAPGIDCLTSLPPEVPWHIARLAASAAELDAKPVVMCETSDHSQVWRPPGDTREKRTVTEAEIRGTCNRLIVSGVNSITSYYSFTGLSDDALRRLNEWVSRCCTLLQATHPVADVAVVYPVESLWTQFVPAEHWANASPEANRIEGIYRSALDSLFAARRDFTIVDSRTLAVAAVEPGTLVRGRLRWRVVVLPAVDTLPSKAWENLARFVAEGGVVIELGARPAHSQDRFPDPKIEALAGRLFGEPSREPCTWTNAAGGAGVFVPSGSEALLPLILDGLLAPDVSVADRHAPLRSTHRRGEGRETYFLINDSPRPWSGRVDLAARGDGERWDPATGSRSKVEDGAALNLELEPYGAALFTFAEARPPERFPARSGGIPNLTFRPLPHVKPVLAQGEFVRGEVRTADSGSGRDQPTWSVEATLTKGQVDTFQFVRLPYAARVNLREAEGLEIESWVPAGQRAPTQLLVILQEQGGGDFLASTPRSLSSAGRERTFIPLSRFQLAGWSQDADGLLDAGQIGEIRIGWGGYLGAEGERIAFGLAPPRAGYRAAR